MKFIGSPAIPLYFLSLYNGGIDAQNTHFQSNKSLNELHFLKYSSIFSFLAKIKDRQFYNQRSNRSMELKSSFFPSEMILSFFSLYNANDNIIFRRESLSPSEMFNSYQNGSERYVSHSHAILPALIFRLSHKLHANQRTQQRSQDNPLPVFYKSCQDSIGSSGT